MEIIDFVLPWGDGSDKEWFALKSIFQASNTILLREPEANSICRDQDLGLQKYWFRAVECFATSCTHCARGTEVLSKIMVVDPEFGKPKVSEYSFTPKIGGRLILAPGRGTASETAARQDGIAA